MTKRTKIVCTVGPSSREVATLVRLGHAGMDVARLNFSHGTHEDHASIVKHLELAGRRLGRPFTLLQDLQGPKIRVGDLPPKGVMLVTGKSAVFTTSAEPAPGDIPVTLPSLNTDVKKGQRILLDDGLLEVRVLRVEGRRVMTEVVQGGLLTSHKGLNLPGASLRIPAVSEKDRADAVFGVKLGVDYIACSFVRSAKDVLDLRRLLDRMGPRGRLTRIIAKIEKQEAVDRFDEILDVVDGIMVARGDLGVETAASSVPVVQKQLIARCRERAIPTIVATQMLYSMTTNPRPTRAEVSDVANAVADHADALMLSNESATGQYPVEAVQVMADTIRSVESSNFDNVDTVNLQAPKNVPEVIGTTVRVIVEALGRVPVVVATLTGRTAREVSACRPEVTILALAPDERVSRSLRLIWGVDPIVQKTTKTPERLAKDGLEALKRARKLKKGQRVVVVTGSPTGKTGMANRIEILTVQ